MVSLRSLLSVLLVMTSTLLHNGAAYMISQSVSSFGGKVLEHRVISSSNNASPSQCRGDMTMKKGKPNVPPQMRAQYRQQQKMASMREQMIKAQTPGEDGLPIFNLFVRSKKTKQWYPCGSFNGDERSQALASSYRDNGLLAGISKNQLDSGVSGSLYRDLNKLVESVLRTYPQLKKSRDELEWGYKLAFEGLSEDKQKINMVTPKESKGLVDGIKGMFGQ